MRSSHLPDSHNPMSIRTGDHAPSSPSPSPSPVPLPEWAWPAASAYLAAVGAAGVACNAAVVAVFARNRKVRGEK